MDKENTQQQIDSLKQQVQQLNHELNDLRINYFKNNFSNLFIYQTPVIFRRNISIDGGNNISLDTVTGSSFGNTTSNKVSVYGVTPIVQQGAITAPTGGATVDSQARTAIGSLITAIKNFGITA